MTREQEAARWGVFCVPGVRRCARWREADVCGCALRRCAHPAAYQVQGEAMMRELPIRHIVAEELTLKAMAERDEHPRDIVWWAGGLMRASDFTHAIFVTDHRVYTVVVTDWDDDGAHTPRVFVSEVKP